MSDPDLCGSCNQDEMVTKITQSIFGDKIALNKIKSKIRSLGKPDLITFTFPAKNDKDAKRISIAYGDFAAALATNLEASTEDGEVVAAISVANAMLSGAFIHATIRNTVIASLEEDN